MIKFLIIFYFANIFLKMIIKIINDNFIYLNDLLGTKCSYLHIINIKISIKHFPGSYCIYLKSQ